MPTFAGRASRWLVVLLAGCLCLPLFVTAALAQEVPAAPGLAPGAAIVANAGSDPVLLRDDPTAGAPVLSSFPEGTAVEVGRGPITAPDGSRWYPVSVAGLTGYMDETYLAPAGSTAAPSPAGTTTPATTAETATATEAVNLRAEPRPDAPVLLVVPAGGALSRTGDVVDGFAPVAYEGATGWAAIAFLTLGATAPDTAATASVEPEPAATADATATPGAEAGTAASATDLLNLRGGPSYDDDVLRVLPPGAPLTVTGPATAGFLPVLYNGTTGWVDAAYLERDAAAAAPEATQAPEGGSDGATGTATTTDTVNLRAGPSEADPVSVVLPAGATLETTGAPQDGFYPVAFADRTGWVADAFLRFDGDAATDPTATTDEETAASPAARPDAEQEAAGFSGVAWPVSGGTWEVLQGYNGSSHQNQDGLWQYYYSLDLVRADGETAGQPVVSPVNGTVRWTDPATGGMSIDVGGGHAVAFFHVAVDPSLEAGDPLVQGQPVGTVSGPGGPGFVGIPHVHFTLWETADGGNWSRAAAPFVGAYAIAGQAFPDTGGANQHAGATFTP